MRNRLDQTGAEYDRTAAMGAFPHDEIAEPLFPLDADRLMTVGADESSSVTDRDQAIWSLVYDERLQAGSRQRSDLFVSVARSAKEPELRRSASWALFKTGEVGLLRESLAKDDDGNVHSWKQHLIYEADGRTDWIDPRPVRVVQTDHGFGTTLPLSIHGVVQFRSFVYGSRYGDGRLQSLSSRAPFDYSKPGGGPHKWHSFPAGLSLQRRLVGDLTASVSPDTFYDNLVIQKTVANPLGDGRDHVQGYLFQGMSRSLGGNSMVHYYTSSGPQPFYLSGRIADRSDGLVEVPTRLTRIAETTIVTNKDVPYPYVQSVRGLFHGPSNLNTILSREPGAPPDNLLQIVAEPYANGYFFGEFRSVPVDVDGDGTVEINGLPMYTDSRGVVLERMPVSREREYGR